MINLIQFSLAGVILILTVITTRFFPDPQITRSSFKPRGLFAITLIYLFAYMLVLYWSFLARQGLPSSVLTGSWADITPQFFLIGIILANLILVDKLKPANFGFCQPRN